MLSDSACVSLVELMELHQSVLCSTYKHSCTFSSQNLVLRVERNTVSLSRCPQCLCKPFGAAFYPLPLLVNISALVRLKIDYLAWKRERCPVCLRFCFSLTDILFKTWKDGTLSRSVPCPGGSTSGLPGHLRELNPSLTWKLNVGKVL